MGNSPNKSAQHANNRTAWRTPPELFAALDREFSFKIDAAADASNALCKWFFDADNNALERDWASTTFCNPPYSVWAGADHKTGGINKSGNRIMHGCIDAWLAHGWEQVKRHGITIVWVLPNDTDRDWWRNHVVGKAERRWINGRVAFGDPTTGAPVKGNGGGSVVVIFRPEHSTAECSIDRQGKVIAL